jgi:hypothetical protein
LFPQKRYCWSCFYKEIKKFRVQYPKLTIWGELPSNQ